ncbi:MAG: PAS domain-containing protein [Oscillospiraceae bacterium]|jgi:PAS domain S-box-containing protein|nr:PAS domain-containing protein [Oscillospiraceae bacterium]
MPDIISGNKEFEYELMKYKLANDALNIALWDMDVVSGDPVNPNNKFTWSQEFRQMLGFSGEADFPNVLQSWSNRLHPNDKERTLDAFAAHIIDRTGKKPYDIEYRLLLKNRSYRYFRAFGTTLRDTDGTPLRVAGAIMDVTEKKQTDAVLKEALDESTKAHQSLKSREAMLSALNKAAIMFLMQNKDTFEETISAGIELIADAVSIDTLTIFQSDGSHAAQVYQWNRNLGGTTSFCGEKTDDCINTKYKPSWDSLLKAETIVNGPVRLLPTRRNSDNPIEEKDVKSIFATPIYVNSSLWGCAVFTDNRDERYFDDNCVDILRSVAFLCTNAIIRNEMEHEIAKINERVTLMLDATPLCCELWDKNYNIIECNEEAVKVFGTGNKKVFMEKVFDFVPEFQPDGQRSEEKAVKCLEKAFAEGRHVFEWTHKLPDGTLVPVESTLVRVNYKNDYVIAAYSRDLREYKRMINEIEKYLFEAQEANRSKSEFLSRMSHEMLTPMNAIIGMTQIAKKKSTTEIQSKFLDEINTASLHLLQLIKDLLDISGRKDGVFILAESAFSFSLMIENIIKETAADFAKKQQTFTYDVDPAIPASLTGDEKRLSQIIVYLLSNAIKFTSERGEIHFSACVVNEDNGAVILQIIVADNGIGIKKEHQVHIFNVFEQVDGSNTRKYGGAGLGLPMARRIVEMMGGKIWVDSDLDKGAKFTFTCKLKPATKHE